MTERFEFARTQDPDYPMRAVGSMPTENFVVLSSLPADILPQDADHVEITIWEGDRTATRFYEEMKPNSQRPTTPLITVDQYLDKLRQNVIPLPPEAWENAGLIFTNNMEIATSIQLARSPDDIQGRVINTTSKAPPTDIGVDSILITTSDWVNELVARGFPRPAFNYYAAPPFVETVGLVSRTLIRRHLSFLQPPPDGQLTTVIRTENSRPKR